MPFVSRKLVSLVFCGLTATLAQAAEPVKPNIKPGLWEVTMDPQMSGEMPIPEEQLAKLSPEQRARFEAAMKSSMTKGALHRVYKECMTPEKIARGFDTDKDHDASCHRKIVSSSASELTVHQECNKPDGKTVSDMHFEVRGGTQANGKIKIVATNGSKSMTVNSTLEGKWLSSSCGSVKDSELER